MAEQICFINKDTLMIKTPKKSPVLLRMIFFVFAMICVIYICSTCINQISTHVKTKLLNIEVMERPCHDYGTHRSQIPYIHYPKPETFSRAECACNPVQFFAILSTQRSGSGWFETLLNSHMNVSSNGEIFSVKERRENISSIVKTLDRVYNLDWFSSASKNECSAAVGFKWMLNQMDIENEMEFDKSGDEVDVVEINEQNIQYKKGGKRKRRLTSSVWAFFDMLPLGTDKKQRCKCKRCGAIYLADSRYGTGNLKRHMDVCVRRDTRDIGQLLLSQSSGSMSMRSSKFDQEKFRELLAVAIIMHDLPFQFVEYDGIRTLIQYLCEDAQPISRNTAKADVLKLYTNEKGRLRHMVGSVSGRICLTSDLWTSLATDGYLCLTAHFIDDDWRLQKRILNFSYMPSPHNGISLTEKIYALLSEWGIEKKLFSITLDNASANTSFVEMLKSQLNLNDALLCGGDFFHIRCCVHVLNLIVQEGLKEIDESVFKIRESVKYIKGSQVRKQKFLECVSHVSLSSKKGLRQDVPTRWNSTFLMLQSAIYYRRAFCHLELSDSNYKFCPSQEEWMKIERICNFLAVFYDVTNIFSGSKYPTSNLYFPLVFLVQLRLKEGKESSNSFICKMATQMYEKFGKYWSEYCMILAIAVILDPRYKLGFVLFSYKKLYGDSSNESKQVRDKLFRLFDEYLLSFPIANSIAVPLEKEQGGLNGIDNIRLSKESMDVMKEFDSFESDELLGSSQKTELELYLDEPKVGRNSDLDVLVYWKANQFRYLVLSQMARDILSIPVSTVASEAAFSAGGRVLDQFRSALKPENVEALVCARDWLFGLKDDMEFKLDEIVEDIMELNINKDDPSSTQCSNTATTVDS